jgi:hypothetical protein
MRAMQVLRPQLLLLIVLALFAETAFAQGINPPSGIAPVQDDLSKHHTDPTGRPCLAIQGYAKPEFVNKNIYQHWIRMANSCGQNIRVRVCYYNTEDCILGNVPAWEKKEYILGIFPALKQFKFQFKEQF